MLGFTTQLREAAVKTMQHGATPSASSYLRYEAVSSAHISRSSRGEGVRFRSLAEGESTWARYLEADEDSPDRFVGELLLQVAARAAAQELEAIRRRTKAGLDRARAEGKTLGRPWAGPEALRQLAAQQRIGGATYGEMAKSLDVGRSTVRSWLKRAGVP